MTRVIVSIDRLVLHGARRGDRETLAAGLSSELSQLFAGPQPALRLSGLGAVPRLTVNVTTPPEGTPLQIGQSAARGIARELRR